MSDKTTKNHGDSAFSLQLDSRNDSFNISDLVEQSESPRIISRVNIQQQAF